MSIRRQYRKSKPSQQMYVVLNQYGEVYMGMIGGQICWSSNWKEAKPLYRESTTLLLEMYKNTELIKEEELK